MVQMVGVIVLALGLPAMFSRSTRATTVDNRRDGRRLRRDARGDAVPVGARGAAGPAASRRVPDVHEVRSASRRSAGSCCCSPTRRWRVTFVVRRAAHALEFAGPWVAERHKGGTPWHAHHIAERYGLLVIIALGEGIIGTIASLSALSARRARAGRSTPRCVALAGVGAHVRDVVDLLRGPVRGVLHVRRERSFGWGYGHIPSSARSSRPAAACTSRPTTSRSTRSWARRRPCSASSSRSPSTSPAIFALYTYLTRTLDRFHLLLIVGSALVAVRAGRARRGGAPMAWCMLVLALAPWVTVVGYELAGTGTTSA